MRIRFSLMLTLLLCLLAAAGPAYAGTLNGVVRNGTSGKALANHDVILIQLQGGMQAVATFKTDAQGRYAMDHPAIGSAPVLVRVQYEGVNYHHNVPPGTTTADIEVFDAAPSSTALQVGQRMIVLQPNASSLLVGEEYVLRNESKPPVTVFKEDGSFEFVVPPGAELGQVSVIGPSGMPLVQGTIDKGKDRYAIAYALRPGETQIRLSYQVPYPNNATKLRAVSPYPAPHVLFFVPPTVKVSGNGLTPAGSSQGWNLFAHEAVAANAPFDFSVSGTAPPPTDAGEQGGGGSRQGGMGAGGGPMTVVPGRLDNLKWFLLAAIGFLFAMGTFYLWKRPVPGKVLVAAEQAPEGVPAAEAPSAARLPAPVTVPTPRTDSAAASQAVAAVDRAVTQSLDEIKDLLFRLELRRQAGTISEEDYARERGRAEKLLRDYLR